MRVFITGIAGFLGTNVALEAFKRGHEVSGIDNYSRHGSRFNAKLLIQNGIKIYDADIRDGGFPYLDVDCIIHLAAQTTVVDSFTEPLEDFSNNVYSTVRMLEYAREVRASFLFASTNKVYNHLGEDEIYVTEESQTTAFLGHTPYGASKLCADLYVQEYFHSFGVPTVVNRMSCIYGRYQHGKEEQGWISHFMQSILADKPITIYGDGKQVRDVLWGGDCAELYIDQMENIDKCKGQVFNIGGGYASAINLLDAIADIERITGKKAKLTFSDWRPNDQKWYVSDVSKIKLLLGWKPTVNLESGLKMMYDAAQ